VQVAHREHRRQDRLHQRLAGLAVVAGVRHPGLAGQRVQHRQAGAGGRGEVHERAAGAERRVGGERAGRQHRAGPVQGGQVDVGGEDRLGGGDVDDHDPVQFMAAAELVEVGDDPGGDRRLQPAGGQRPQRLLVGGELLGQRADQPPRQHPGGGQRLGLLQHRRGDDVVAADDQVGPGRQGGAAELRQLGDASGGAGQPRPERQRAHGGGDGHRPPGADQPDSGTHARLPSGV
jgi:hypothetical protein